MIFTVLGCGTSTGVPLIHCGCSVCTSPDPKNKRLRASVWLRTDQTSLLIDSSIDLRQQALREHIPRVDAVLYTHPHADHLFGIDDLRSFNFIQKKAIPLYGSQWTIDTITKQFTYIFGESKVEGGGVPRLTPNLLKPDDGPFSIGDIKIIPIWVKHGSNDCVGYRFDSIAYITDCSYIPSQSLELLKGLSVLFLDCLRIKAHATHLNLDQALEVIRQVQPERTFLTHLGHDFDYAECEQKLPPGVFLAFDGLEIRS